MTAGAYSEHICGSAEMLVPIVRPKDSAGVNDVYKGFAILPDRRTPVPVYLKIFPKASSSQSIYNEVTAHHLAVQCGIPSPFTFPCECPVSLLSENKRALVARLEGSQSVFGVASIDVCYKQLGQASRISDALINDLLYWDSCAKVAVFDELIANQDRHMSNMIRIGRHNYRVIDHEKMIFDDSWFVNASPLEYKGRNSSANALARTIANCTDELLRQKMKRTANEFLREIVLHPPSISEGLERVCHAPAGVTERLISMLNERRTHLPRLIQMYFQENSLFQASAS